MADSSPMSKRTFASPEIRLSVRGCALLFVALLLGSGCVDLSQPKSMRVRNGGSIAGSPAGGTDSSTEDTGLGGDPGTGGAGGMAGISGTGDGGNAGGTVVDAGRTGGAGGGASSLDAAAGGGADAVPDRPPGTGGSSANDGPIGTGGTGGSGGRTNTGGAVTTGGTQGDGGPDAPTTGGVGGKGGTGGKGGAAGTGGVGGSGGVALDGGADVRDAAPDTLPPDTLPPDTSPPDTPPDTICTLCPLRAALVHRYSFSGSDTTVTDSVGTANGTVVNAQLSGSGTLVLAGGNQYADLPDHILSSLTDATLEIWVTWSGSGNNNQRILDFGSNEQSGSRTQATTTVIISPNSAPNGTPKLRASYSNRASVSTYVEGSGTLATGQRHIAVVFDSKQQRLLLYLDGALVGQTTGLESLSLINDVNNWLGRSQYSDDPYFNGTLHEFRIYGAALTAEQVQMSFTAGPNSALDQ